MTSVLCKPSMTSHLEAFYMLTQYLPNMGPKEKFDLVGHMI